MKIETRRNWERWYSNKIGKLEIKLGEQVVKENRENRD